jgi:hypothetical protein
MGAGKDFHLLPCPKFPISDNHPHHRFNKTPESNCMNFIIGIDDFGEVITEKFNFVDKSLFIKEHPMALARHRIEK